MNFVAIKPQSLAEQVSDQLVNLIRNQSSDSETLMPPERRLAEQLGVSRQVVREAIKRLELLGLLEVRQGSGIRIIDKLHRPLNTSLSLLIPNVGNRLRQLQETRGAIEPIAAQLAALRATSEQIACLWAIQARLEKAGDDAEAIEIDLEFHHTLAEASGNLMFRLILDSLGEISQESRQLTIKRVGIESAIEHHRSIVAAIESHDPPAAEEAMRHHLREAHKDLELELSENENSA